MLKHHSKALKVSGGGNTLIVGVVEFALMRCLVPRSTRLNLITLFYIRLYINIHMHVRLTSTIGHIKVSILVCDKMNEPKQVRITGFLLERLFGPAAEWGR